MATPNDKAVVAPQWVVPNPDPSVRTVEQLQRDIGASREIVEGKVEGNQSVFEARLAGMDKAIELLQRSTDRIPGHIKGEVEKLEALHGEKFQSVERRTEIQFASIATQFQERDKRTEQLSLADKTAIAAALQAQKEAAGAQNESNAAANAKMEANFAKLIEQGQSLLMEVRRNTEAQINDLKSRLDKGEGRTVATRDIHTDNRGMIALIVAVIGTAIALGVALLKH